MLCVFMWHFTEMHMIRQGVVTYMSPVEAFVTRIKMESSDQCRSWFRDQDELWATYISWSTQILGRRGNAFVHWSLAKSSGQKLWKETSDQGRFSPSKILDPGCKCYYYGQYVSDYYPLSGFWTWVQVKQGFIVLHNAHVMLHDTDAKCTANLTADGLTWQVCTFMSLPPTCCIWEVSTLAV